MRGDIEVMFCFYEYKQFLDGFRPAHKINGILTTGLHRYKKDKDEGTEVAGTIELLAPEYFANSLHVGEKIFMYEGSKEIGFAEVKQIINPILEAER